MAAAVGKSVKDQELRKKTIFSLDSPNSVVEWPSINNTDQDVIMDLLCSILTPIGQHRTLYAQPSKGKRSRKRKYVPPIDDSASAPPTPSAPPLPELTSFLTIGLNSTTRRLESMAAAAASSAGEAPSSPRLLAVFVCRSDSQPSQLHAHLPLLCNIASRSSPKRVVKLVQLPKGTEARLAASLAIPQVGFLGLIEGAPGSTSLLRFLEENVPAVKVPWLEGSLEYQPTVVRAMKTIAPPSHKKKAIVRVDSIEKMV